MLAAGVEPDRIYEDLASGRRDDRPLAPVARVRISDRALEQPLDCASGHLTLRRYSYAYQKASSPFYGVTPSRKRGRRNVIRITASFADAPRHVGEEHGFH